MGQTWRGTEAEIAEQIAEARLAILADAAGPGPAADLPIVIRHADELGDLRKGGDGYFRMGAQVGWSPAREGYGQAPISARAARRHPGQRRAQDPRSCDVCGGVTDVCDLESREELASVPRALLEPGWPLLRPEDTCAGCLRSGEAVEAAIERARAASAAPRPGHYDDLNAEAAARRLAPIRDLDAAERSARG